MSKETPRSSEGHESNQPESLENDMRLAKIEAKAEAISIDNYIKKLEEEADRMRAEMERVINVDRHYLRLADKREQIFEALEETRKLARELEKVNVHVVSVKDKWLKIALSGKRRELEELEEEVLEEPEGELN